MIHVQLVAHHVANTKSAHQVIFDPIVVSGNVPKGPNSATPSGLDQILPFQASTTTFHVCAAQYFLNLFEHICSMA